MKICQCGAWRRKTPDHENGRKFDPWDNFLVMMEEFEDWDEEEIVGEGAECGELKTISPLFGSSEGNNLTSKCRKSEILISECFGCVEF